MKKEGVSEKGFKGSLGDQVIQEGKSLMNELGGVAKSLRKYGKELDESLGNLFDKISFENQPLADHYLDEF